jgi:hypothetical protein
MELMQANHQWSTRPDDQRFTSLTAMRDHFNTTRLNSRATVVSSRRLEVVPADDNRGLAIQGANGHAYAPTNWAFGQLAQLAEAPAGYLRSLPAPIAADCINYGLKFKRDIEDVGVLLQRPIQDDTDGASVPATPIIPAVTGPRYGRIWNADVLSALVKRFGDGVTGNFRVPGEFGKAVEITKANTTLFAGDRDMFVFLADEENRIEIPDRRDGRTGSLARGFFMWNSEVGSTTFGVGTFLYDYVCCNRIVWGAQQYREVKLRHTAAAPDRFLAEVQPALISYANSSTTSIVEGIAKAKAARLDDVDEWLAKRFGKRTVAGLQAVHNLEEGRPIETLWDVSTALTAKARSVPYQDERVAMERQAGDVLDLAI